MSDLIERLYKYADMNDDWPPPAHVVRQAADEIEGLRRELAEARQLNADWLAANGPGGWIDNQRRELAEARGLLREARAVIGKASRDLNARDYAGAHRLLDAFLAKEQP